MHEMSRRAAPPWGPPLALPSPLTPHLSRPSHTLQNAYTSADETCYTLVVPTDTPELLSDALRVVAQFAFHIRWGRLIREGGAALPQL